MWSLFLGISFVDWQSSSSSLLYSSYSVPLWDGSQTALIRHDLLHLGLSSFEIYKKVTPALDSIIAAWHRPRQSPLCLEKTEIKMGPGYFPDQRVLIASVCS